MGNSLPALRLLPCCCSVATCWCTADTADVSCRATQALEIWRAFQANDGSHWPQDLPGLLVSNEGNYRNVQVEGLSKGSTLRTLVRKITKIFRLRRLWSSWFAELLLWIIGNVAQKNWGWFSWRMLSTWCLTTALCQHRPKQNVIHS